MSLCGECGGSLVDHRCVDCGTRHDSGMPNALPPGSTAFCGLVPTPHEPHLFLARSLGGERPMRCPGIGPGACGDPACPVLHADPANPIHPPWYLDSRVDVRNGALRSPTE